MKATEKLRRAGYDIDFVQRIQPQGGIHFGERFINCGDGYQGCLYVYSFAEEVYRLWLASPMRMESSIATMHFSTVNKEEVLRNINRSITELRDRENTGRSTTDRDDAHYELMNLREFAQSITQGGEVVKLVHLRIFFYDFSKADLEKKMKDAKEELRNLNHKATINLFLQNEEWSSLFESVAQHEFRPGAVLPATSIGGGLPFHYQALKDPRGGYLGRTSTDGAFIFDPFYSTSTRRSFNGFVLGKMGCGKSTALKMMCELLAARDSFIRGFDKSGEYRDLVLGLGGKMIDLAGGSGMINPLEVYATQTDTSGAVVDEYGSFMRHVDKVSNMMRFLNPEMPKIALDDFKGLLRQFYIHKKLLPSDYIENVAKVKITGLEPTAYPTLSQFRAWLKNFQYKTATIDRIRTLEEIQIMVDAMVEQYGPLFDGHTTIPNIDDEQIVYFDIDSISQLDKEVFNCQLYTALTLIWNHALKNGRRMKQVIDEQGAAAYPSIKYFMVYIDECHNVINAENAFAVDYVTSFQREMRKMAAGVWFATQSPNEMLPESASDQTVAKMKTVFELTQYKVFFSLDNSVLGRMREVLGDSLTETEYQMLPELPMGKAVFQLSAGESCIVQFEPDKAQLARFKGGQ